MTDPLDAARRALELDTLRRCDQYNENWERYRIHALCELASISQALIEAREEMERLRAAILDCARVNATMEGPRYKGMNVTAFRRLYEEVRETVFHESPEAR